MEARPMPERVIAWQNKALAEDANSLTLVEALLVHLRKQRKEYLHERKYLHTQSKERKERKKQYVQRRGKKRNPTPQIKKIFHLY